MDIQDAFWGFGGLSGILKISLIQAINKFIPKSKAAKIITNIMAAINIPVNTPIIFSLQSIR
ncbi:MAG: hypothetical protein LBE91_17705 [Tannerella sp.]|nr:hypothetical protein [Tannerella sp.]